MTQILELSLVYGVNYFALLLHPVQHFGISNSIGPRNPPHSTVPRYFKGLQFVHVVFLEGPSHNSVQKRWKKQNNEASSS